MDRTKLFHPLVNSIIMNSDILRYDMIWLCADVTVFALTFFSPPAGDIKKRFSTFNNFIF